MSTPRFTPEFKEEAVRQIVECVHSQLFCIGCWC
jgi:transposase-like protein